MLLILGLKVNFNGNLFGGIIGGCADEVKCWSNNEIKAADIDRLAVEKCLPPSKFFSEEGYNSFIKKVISKNLKDAEKELLGASNETPVHVCFNVFLKVARGCCTNCPKLLSDALPMTYY